MSDDKQGDAIIDELNTFVCALQDAVAGKTTPQCGACKGRGMLKDFVSDGQGGIGGVSSRECRLCNGSGRRTSDACSICKRVGCPGAPRFKGICNGAQRTSDATRVRAVEDGPSAAGVLRSGDAQPDAEWLVRLTHTSVGVTARQHNAAQTLLAALANPAWRGPRPAQRSEAAPHVPNCEHSAQSYEYVCTECHLVRPRPADDQSGGLHEAARIVDRFMDGLTGAMDRGIAYAIGVEIRKAAYDAEHGLARESPRPSRIDAALESIAMEYPATGTGDNNPVRVSVPNASVAERVVRNLTHDFRCGDCGTMIKNHVVVSRCEKPGCEESYTGPEVRALVEHFRIATGEAAPTPSKAEPWEPNRAEAVIIERAYALRNADVFENEKVDSAEVRELKAQMVEALDRALPYASADSSRPTVEEGRLRAKLSVATLALRHVAGCPKSINVAGYVSAAEDALRAIEIIDEEGRSADARADQKGCKDGA